MSLRVLALTRYDDLGSSSRVRVLQYRPHLAKRGITVEVQPLFSNESLQRLYRDGRRSKMDLVAALMQRLDAVTRKSRADVVWLQQELFPYLPAGLETTLLAGCPYVIDFDDAQQLYYQAHRSATVQRLYGDKIARLMRAAAAVVVGSDSQGAYAREAGAKAVHLVYSAVDTERFAQAAAQPLPTPFRVGWIGTPMTAEQSLHILREPLKRFLAETDASATFMGMDAPQLPDLPGTRVPWREAAEPEFMAGISVGLCPLDDSPWTRGKSGYKIIQYMSAGRAALTSPVGIAAQIVRAGETGLHCRTGDDWYNGLMSLYRNPAQCAAFGAAARNDAVKIYDTRIAANALCDILTDARS